MTAADKAKLLALADQQKQRSFERYGSPYADGCSIAYAICADELRAVVEELENGDGTQ